MNDKENENDDIEYDEKDELECVDLDIDIDDEYNESNNDLDIDIDDEDDKYNESNNDFDFKFINQQNKHKIEGKHSLERDVLFAGKIEEKDDVDEYSSTIFNEEVSVETGSRYEYESINNMDYLNDINLEQDVHEILTNDTDLDFNQNRRKPRREDFNDYFELLIKKLKHKYTRCEIFVALSYYFTDNIFNMYKLLEKKYATVIIMELKQKGYLDNLGDINFV
jgi:hypothetical protein